MKTLWLATWLYLLLSSTRAEEWSAHTFPNPDTPEGAKLCNRKNVKGSSVCDPDKILSEESANVVEGIIRDIGNAVEPYRVDKCPQRSTDHPGFQVAVALMEKMKVQDESSQEAAHKFAIEIFDTWGLGDPVCGNGVLLLLSRQDRQVRIQAGKQALTIAPEDKLAIVVNNMRPRLRSGDYDAAIEHGVVDLGLVLAGINMDPHGDDSGDSDEDSGGGWALVFIFGAFAAILFPLIREGRRNSRDQTRCHRLLEKLKAEQERAVRTGKYPAASCPICFEDFEDNNRPSAPPLEADQGNGSKGGAEAAQAHEIAKPLLAQQKENQRDPQSSGRSAKQQVKKPLPLPCGHTFCEPCISQWLKAHITCPVCRTPVGEDDPQTRSSQQLPTGATTTPSDYALYEQEMQFRMDGLHRLFPQIVTGEIISRAMDSTAHRECIQWPQIQAQQHSMEERSRHMDIGSSGHDHSFGGGHHAGGGGVSGSW